ALQVQVHGVRDPEAIAALKGATVDVTGVCIARADRARRLTEVYLAAPSPDQVTVLERPRPDQACPVPSVAALRQFNPRRRPFARVQVQGTVVGCWAGRLYVQDDGTGLVIPEEQPSDLRPGDLVEVTGVPVLGTRPAVVLWDPVLRLVGKKELPPPVALLEDGAVMYDRDASRVWMEGIVVDQSTRDQTRPLSGPVSVPGRAEPSVLSASYQLPPGAADPPEVALGSRVRLTGVATFANFEHAPQSFHLYMSGPGDVQVLQGPALMTWQNAMPVVA